MLAESVAFDVEQPEITILAELNRRVDEVVEEFQASAISRLVVSSDAALIAATFREIYWEIHCYQPLTTKAGFAMIGAVGPLERKVMRILLLHKWEEVEHSVWALDGYKALGGDQSRIGREAEFTSPGAFAVAAVWERLARMVNPLAYLGAEYLFEDLTARLTKLVTGNLADRGFPKQGMRFVIDHATEDEKHSNLLAKLIRDVVQRRPELAPEILFAFDCFKHVYPMPLWLASLARAQAGTKESVLMVSNSA
jgi:Iron-containing redox enzyme